MLYIRLLKPPPFSIGRDQSLTIVVTVCNDLGEQFYQDALDLEVRLSASTGAPQTTLATYLGDSSPYLTISMPVKGLKRTSSISLEVCVRNDGDHSLTGLASFVSDHGLILPIRVDAIQVKHEESKADRHSQAIRLLHMANGSMTIYEDTGNSIDRHLWDCGVTVSWFIHTCYDDLELASSISVIELGAGTGVSSIALAITRSQRSRMKTSIVCTDLEPALGLIRQNFDNNAKLVNRSVDIKVTELDWASTLPVSIRKPDLILLTDVAYNHDSFDMLLGKVNELAALPGDMSTRILFGYKYRHEREQEWFEKARSSGWQFRLLKEVANTKIYIMTQPVNNGC